MDLLSQLSFELFTSDFTWSAEGAKVMNRGVCANDYCKRKGTVMEIELILWQSLLLLANTVNNKCAMQVG